MRHSGTGTCVTPIVAYCAVGEVAEQVRERDFAGQVFVERVGTVDGDDVGAAVVADEHADLAPVRAEVLASGIVDFHLHARRDERLRHLALVHPALVAARVDDLEPVGAPRLDLDRLAALDDVEHREAAARPGAKLEVRIGDGDREPFGSSHARRRQKEQQPAGREPRHHLS